MEKIQTFEKPVDVIYREGENRQDKNMPGRLLSGVLRRLFGIVFGLTGHLCHPIVLFQIFACQVRVQPLVKSLNSDSCT
jgi:hypothetical protein